MNDVLDLAIRKIILKIEEERLTTNFNFDKFVKENSSLQKFLINYQMQNTFIHLDLTEENYQTILQYLNKIYASPKKTKEKKVPTQKIFSSVKKFFKNITKEEKVDAFMDALTLAFIAGSIYGLGLLSVYSKIMSTIS